MDNVQAFALASGVILSVLFSYVPGLKTWYGAKSPEVKQLVMLVILAGVAIVAGALSCANVAVAGVPVFECSTQGITDLITVFIMAVVGNVAGYQSTNYIKQ